MKGIKAVFVDFDGTLATDNKTVSAKDRRSLLLLGAKNIVRVLATGRSLYSVNLVLEQDFPIDYIVFSSGSGIYDFNKKEIIHTRNLSKGAVTFISNLLLANNIDFKLLKPIPENYKYVYYPSSEPVSDVKMRIEMYKKFELPYVKPEEFGEAGQVLAVIENPNGMLTKLENCHPDVTLVRATSPLDGKSVWAEFFPKGVNKAYGAHYICELFGIKAHETIAIGNDYNDLAILEFTPNAFVVNNAPYELKAKFNVVESNNNNGVSAVIGHVL